VSKIGQSFYFLFVCEGVKTTWWQSTLRWGDAFYIRKELISKKASFFKTKK
jgi:hypothetical protein